MSDDTVHDWPGPTIRGETIETNKDNLKIAAYKSTIAGAVAISTGVKDPPYDQNNKNNNDKDDIILE